MLRTLTTTALLIPGIASAHADDASTLVSYGDLDLSQIQPTPRPWPHACRMPLRRSA